MSMYKAQVVLGVPDSTCEKHSKKLVLYFCKTCNDSGCSKCMQTKHKHHDWCDIEDIAGEKQSELERNLMILENTTLPRLIEMKVKTETGQIDPDENEIGRQADLMIDVINKHRQALIS